MQDKEEPAYCIFAATETLQESKGFDFNVLRVRVPDHDVTFAEAGRWLYPEASLHLDKLGLVSHRLDEQNRIMDHNRQSQNLSYSNQEGMTIEADMVLDESGNIVPLEKIESKQEWNLVTRQLFSTKGVAQHVVTRFHCHVTLLTING